MTLKDCPWRPVGSARPRLFRSPGGHVVGPDLKPVIDGPYGFEIRIDKA
jgi:hypothetical protein